jgi:thymidylate kinase
MADIDHTGDDHPLLVTFSGLDGSGKSTQIANLQQYLRTRGLRSVSLAFWDNVVVGKGYRERFVHKVYGSEPGVGTPEKPVVRRDKNVRKWYLSIARHGLYLLDAIHLCEVLGRARRGHPDVIIMDRYIYDQLANLPLGNPLSRSFVRMVDKLVPRPDVAYLLDTDVEAARARKPEYPIDFMRDARRAYLRLAQLVRGISIVPALELADARRAVQQIFDDRIGRHAEQLAA